jgi:hypothetical protein
MIPIPIGEAGKDFQAEAGSEPPAASTSVTLSYNGQHVFFNTHHEVWLPDFEFELVDGVGDTVEAAMADAGNRLFLAVQNRCTPLPAPSSCHVVSAKAAEMLEGLQQDLPQGVTATLEGCVTVSPLQFSM